MAKRLYDLLVLCKDEEEVKSEFAKFFKIKLVTHKYKIDLYTNNTLFEFKHDRNFKSRTERAKVIAQTLYYVRKLKFGASTDPVPETICIVDKNEGFFVRTRDFHQFYNASAKYDWDRAASQPCPVLVESLKQSPLIADIHMYRFENPAEEDLFVNHVYAVAQQPLFQTDKKDINEDNFENVFYYWCTLFKKYVENGHKASEYFVSDIEEGRSKVIGDNEILFRLGDGTISKSVPMNEYNYFWNIYEKVQNPAIIKAIRQKIDRLSEDFSRRFTGEFYTPIEFAAKAFEYIKRTVGSEKYKQGNWRIWDMAAGTGNVMNEMYARDVSKKTKAAKKAKAKAGQFMGSKPPFGYKLDPNDRHHLVIDEPAAEVVRRIFRLTAEGIGYNKITKIFRAEKVLNPIAYFNQHNPNYFKSDYWRKEFDWHVTSVRVILNNEVYLGRLVYGKQRAKSMKSKQVVKCPREDWIVVEHCHEPIISQELWDTVHKIMNAKHRPAKTGEVQMFAGLLYCADCGHALTYSQKKRKDGTYHGAYSCWMYKTHGKEYCTSHYIRYDTVYDLVLIDLRSVLWNYRHNKKQFRAFLERKFHTDSAKEAKKLQAEYEKKQSRFEEIDRILCKLYEDSVLGKIPESRYEAMSAQYESEQREIKAALPDLRQRIEQLKAESDATDKFVNLIKKYTVIDRLDAAILNELIDKIVVHHKEVAEDGRVFQQVEIYYRFIGKLEHAAESEKAA